MNDVENELVDLLTKARDDSVVVTELELPALRTDQRRVVSWLRRSRRRFIVELVGGRLQLTVLGLRLQAP